MATTTVPAPSESIRDTRPAAMAWVTSHRLRVWLAATVVVIVSLWSSLSTIGNTRFHPDESRWINRGYYVREILHPLSITWQDRYLTRGQPPIGSYAIGLGLLAQGRDLETNGPWDFRFGNEDTVSWNVAHGNMPAWDDLVAARRTSALLSALTCLALFLIVARFSHWIGGAFAGLFFALHPLARYLSTLATSDALFTFLVAASTLAAIWLAQRPSWPRTIVLGVLLGLGGGTKLSPLFVALAVALFGVALLLGSLALRVGMLRRLLGWLPGLGTARANALGWLLLAVPVIAVITFLVTYPYLWPDPIGRTQAIFDFRRDEMTNQARIWPISSIDTRTEALSRIWTNLETDYSTTGRLAGEIGRALGRSTRDNGIDLPIALVGLAILIVLAVRRGVASPTMLGVVIVGAQTAVILTGLRVDFNRYYLPLVFVAAIGIGVAMGQTCRGIQALLARNRRPALPAPSHSTDRTLTAP